MVTFLSGGTGTPKLLQGVSDRSGATVVGNTGDDVELGGHLVCPDLDTVLYLDAGLLDRDRWWGIEGDSTTTHDRLAAFAPDAGPDPLPPERQTAGRPIARWRRFSGIGEFMQIGDRDRAVHLARTSLLDAGRSLTEATRWLSSAMGTELDLLPMSDDPVASYVQTPTSALHFQAFWVGHGGEPTPEGIEYRGADAASPTDEVIEALEEPVVIGPSNPVTSIGPMLALDGFTRALDATTVVAVSPFVGDRVFSGPAAELMSAVGREPSTAGVAEAYPFADAFVLDEDDPTGLDRPVVRTDTRIQTAADASRVYAACERALTEVAA